jgi:glycosyltransferase A (GT-A) superfamily protein (DUF2064 family)
VLGAAAAARLYEAMLRDSLDRFAHVGASRLVLLAAPEHSGAAALRAIAPAGWEIMVQQGDDLGARLTNAMATLGQGGDVVALASSDSPLVPIAPMGEALAALTGPLRALLGPCDDGGYYLIALSTPALGVFRGIRWGTPGVLEATRARCRELSLELRELPSSYDIDQPSDLRRIKQELEGHPERAPRTAALLAQLRLEGM